MQKKSKKKYAERDDLEKLESQFNKIKGLMKRKVWSAAIVRAATAAEIAANLAIRNHYKVLGLDNDEAVDGLLKWANGLTGKLNGLLLPSLKTTDFGKQLKNLSGTVERLNRIRNSIVHSGHFCSKKESQTAIEDSQSLVAIILQKYEPMSGLLSKLKKNNK